ncbi:MAG TPA: hypothetical protein DER33_01795 [Syntrophomonas sp.]|nr:hypothetical protein [Syntrophomonas sp.]HCF70321.1 hypothetical protein [Syntrophomonas sp.]
MHRRKFAFIPVMAVFVSLFTLLVCLPAAYAQQEAGLQVKGEMVQSDPAPFIADNRVMVPVRETAAALGADVSWNGENQSVQVSRGQDQITMFIGNFQVLINGRNEKVEGAPVIVNGKAMVPVRVLADALKLPVAWDSENRVVSLGKAALVAGSSLDFPPFEFKEGDEVVGFEIDLIKALEEISGEEITVKDISFDQLFPSLRSGEVDMIISGITIVEQRKEIVDFTMPYFDWGQIILTRKDSSQDLTLEDLAGKKIASQAGSYPGELLDDFQENHPGTQIKFYDELEDVWTAVEKGEVEAALVPHAPTAYYLTRHKDCNLQMTGKVFASQPSGIAVQKGNQELLTKLNNSLETIKKNGTYDRIYEKWFGAPPAFTQEEANADKEA